MRRAARTVFLTTVFLVVGAVVIEGCGSSNGDGGGFDPTPPGTADSGKKDGTAPTGTTPPDNPGSDASIGSGNDATAHPSDGSIFNDARLDVEGDSLCTQGDAGPAKYPQRCVPRTDNECDGTTDNALVSLGVSASLKNGTSGNGFDDDCDGLVDEGCSCPQSGQTKDCYLIPPTQADPATGKPVGWCTTNSKGSVDCKGTEFKSWSGTCRGAQPPYRDDVCAAGDFNCDGVPANAPGGCACKADPVTCPTGSVTRAPYPDPKNIALIDGSQWITDATLRPSATNWAWTVIGGDCDNVLPFPTFAVYKQADTTAAGSRIGTRQAVRYDTSLTPPEYVSATSSPLISIGVASASTTPAQIFPAFGLSGDYIVQGEFDLNGKHYVCTQKVEVRAPGIRAELCWDTVGRGSDGGGNDIDLHFGRLQGLTCSTPGWAGNCGFSPPSADCYWNGSVSGCRDNGDPKWNYAAASSTACIGWSSPRSKNCTNPRLDKDNVQCNRKQADPTVIDASSVPGDSTNGFCGPENINVDNPNDGDRFVVGVTHYGVHGGSNVAHPHVNIYCNGRRVLSAGYNPATGQQFPALLNAGGDSTGDYWTAAVVTAHVASGSLASCDVDTIPSKTPDASRDGPNGTTFCVDSATAGAPYVYTSQKWAERSTQSSTAGIPIAPKDWCKH